MKRKAVVLLTLATTLVCMLAVGVEAQRGRRGRRGARAGRQPAAQQAAPQSDAIAGALGDLRWGMEPREVHQYFANKINERYRERLAKAPGAIEEDRVRAEQQDEIRRLRESYVRFDGDRSGWDLSFLRGEFTHGNRESMLVYRDDNSQNFYFFIGGRLWKWYKAFDANVFQGQGFDQFAGAVQGRFGRAVERSGRLIERGPEQRWLEWQDRSTRLRAIDQTRFYGFYCLVFEDKATLGRLDELRTNTVQTNDGEGHALVDSVVLPQGESTGSENDAHADIVDRITGRVRRQPAPAAASNASGAQGANGGQSGAANNRSPAASGRRGSGSSGRGDTLDLSDL